MSLHGRLPMQQITVGQQGAIGVWQGSVTVLALGAVVPPYNPCP